MIAHDALTGSQRLFALLSLAAAFPLLATFGVRIVARVDLWQWWVPVAFVSGIAAADFASGLVHWGADTWGRDDLPIIGHRLLVPFRVHHINPDDFLRRRFIDTNGDSAFVAVPVLLGLLAVPSETAWGAPVAVFGLGFCGIGMFTNQIHQWAHMPSPPRPIRVLQGCGLLLGRTEHAAHHERPYDRRYCISTGWCNQPLETIGFFRRLETVITNLTGAQPRQDDRRYEERYGCRRRRGAPHGRREPDVGSGVTVVDTVPPVIESVTASDTVLWPPNHKLVPIGLTVDVTDVCDAASACQITGVTSDEPINGPGDGSTLPDWVLTGPLTLQLRAERDGGGDGRVYTVHVSCTDEFNNASSSSVNVLVPHPPTN